MIPQGPWLSTAEIVAQLPFNGTVFPEQTVAKWCKRRELKAVKMNKRWFTKQEWLDKFIEGRANR